MTEKTMDLEGKKKIEHVIKAHAAWHGTWVCNFYLALELSLHNKSSLSLSTMVSCWPLLNHDSYELDFASLTYGLDFASSTGFRLSIIPKV